MTVKWIDEKRGGGYWLATCRCNGRLILAEGRTRLEAATAALEMIGRQINELC